MAGIAAITAGATEAFAEALPAPGRWSAGHPDAGSSHSAVRGRSRAAIAAIRAVIAIAPARRIAAKPLLHCNIGGLLVFSSPNNQGDIGTVLDTWNTKFGNRRVKQALPTIDEALAAAECMNGDPEQQIEIAASLLGVEADEVREVARKMKKQTERRITLSVAPDRRVAPRPVLVEYRTAKRLVGAR
jgi:hypothetical protein